GPIWFIPIGIVYRLVADLSFGAAQREGGISSYSLLLFSGYWAIGMGVFNTYRAFVVGFILPAVLICAFLFLRQMLLPPPEQYEIEQPLYTDAPMDVPVHQQMHDWT